MFIVVYIPEHLRSAISNAPVKIHDMKMKHIMPKIQLTSEHFQKLTKPCNKKGHTKSMHLNWQQCCQYRITLVEIGEVMIRTQQKQLFILNKSTYKRKLT